MRDICFSLSDLISFIANYELTNNSNLYPTIYAASRKIIQRLQINRSPEDTGLIDEIREGELQTIYNLIERVWAILNFF